jgi:hypothetical protein
MAVKAAGGGSRPDLRGLVAELEAGGVVTSYGAVWRAVRSAGLSFKNVWRAPFASGFDTII